MAWVWLARRADGADRRQVALKVPAISGAQSGLVARFAVERDILAALEHPHIARLYDAGVAHDGLPYIALEYVDGTPLIEWCARHRLGLRQRLQLVIQALDAVDHAHERHIVHRDLKPANILITESGQVRLLDFGVAKLMAADDEPLANGPELTALYGRAMTPGYASPEQLRGDPVGTASDIYSMGVVLYELLAGSLPLPVVRGISIRQRAAQLERLRIVPPSRISIDGGPGERLEVEAVARLNRAVLKSLALEPARRPRSAGRFAEALRQVLGWKSPYPAPAPRQRSARPVAQRRRAAILHFGVLFVPDAPTRQAASVTVGRYGGHLVAGPQGEALVQFADDTEALHAAIALQRARRLRNTLWADDLPALGLDVGDVTDRGTSLEGRPVQVAARLQRLTPLGLARSVDPLARREHPRAHTRRPVPAWAAQPVVDRHRARPKVGQAHFV